MGNKRPDGDGLVRKRDDGRWEGRIVVGHKEDGTPSYKAVAISIAPKEFQEDSHPIDDDEAQTDYDEDDENYEQLTFDDIDMETLPF